jgi:hypothetical protein
MKYYKYVDEYSHIAPGMTYIETDDGWQIRQITCNEEECFASNRKCPPWGLILGESQTDYDGFDDVTPITKEEFDEVWNAHLADHLDEWEANKALYPVGKEVNGFMLIFFPQGVIVDLGDNALGVANYAASKASAKPDFIMTTRYKITATVKDYDEINQWVVLESPQVQDERVPL